MITSDTIDVGVVLKADQKVALVEHFLDNALELDEIERQEIEDMEFKVRGSMQQFTHPEKGIILQIYQDDNLPSFFLTFLQNNGLDVIYNVYSRIETVSTVCKEQREEKEEMEEL